MRNASLDGDAIRIYLHLVAVAVWIGGQIVVGGIVPALRRSHPDALGAVAKAFGQVAWPAFVIAIFTGVWNMMAVDGDATTTGWSAVLGIKILLVVLTGAATWVHQSTSKASIRGASAALGLLLSLVVALMGVMLSA